VVCLIGGARFIHKFKVKLSHLWEVLCHLAADLLGVTVILQVRVVHKDIDLVGRAHEEVAPSK
jgi:hypothetical protein